MNTRIAVIWGLATAAIAAVVGAVAYHAGQVAAAGQPAVDGFYRGFYGFGFFPFFGFLPLLLIGILVFALLFRRPWGRGPWGWGPYGLSDWHRQAHGDIPPAPGGQPGDRPLSGGQSTDKPVGI